MTGQPVERKELALFLCFTFFLTGLIVANITATKLWSFSFIGFDFIAPVGTVLIASTFLMTDLITEVWGKHTAIMAVWLGFAARLFMLVFFAYAVWIEPAGFWKNQEAYASVLQGSSRIIIAGLVAYLVSQMNDVWIFHRLKKRHEGQNRLWVRNNVSTFISQLLDSTIFITLAFWGTMPVNILLSLIAGQVLIKWLFALIDTPLLYLLRNLAQARPLLDLRG